MALRVWLPLNGNLNNQGLSNYSLSIARGSEIYDNNGKIGKCFYANGVNTIKIQNIIPDFYNYTGYTLSVWLYVEAQNTVHTGSAVISAGNWNQQVLNLSLGSWNTNRYSYLYVSGTSWGHSYSYNFYINTWYHVVVSSDGIKTYAYVNGTLIGDTQAGFLPTNIQGNDIYIGGASYYSGMQFFGKINDVRIYDHCLSPKEVKEISKGLILHYPLNNIPQQNLLPEISDANYSIANYSNRTPGIINNGVYHVDGYQSSTSIDTSFGLQTKSYLTLQADTDYYLSFYCKGKCDSSIYFGNNITNNAQTRLKSDSGNLYRPLESKTLGTEFSEFVILKYHTGSETQYHLCIGFDTPNLYGIGSYIEFSNINLTTDDPSIRGINSLLPIGVELYEYLESTGTQWIDTGVKGYMNHTYEIDFQMTDTNNYRTWGVLGQSSYVGYNMSFTYANSWAIRWESVSGNQRLIDNISTKDTNRHLLKISNGAIYFDNISKGTSAGHNTNTVINYNLFLFTINPANTTPSTNAKVKIYAYKDIDSDGNFIRNMLPCTYFGEPGMWDTIENKFYSNKGTGDFILGNKIKLKQYEYLESNGSQWINSKYVPNNSSGMKFEAYCSTSGGNHQIAGVRQSSTDSRWWINFSNTLEFSWNTWISSGVSDYTNKWVTVEHNYLNNRVGKINDVIKRTDYPQLSNITYPAYIFNSCNQGNLGNSFIGKIKYIKFTEENRIVRDFIPCSYNGTLGLWDKVEWKFYENEGTTPFTVGDETSYLYTSNIIYDCSGYQHNGTIVGDTGLNINTPRYNSSLTNKTRYPLKSTINFPESKGLTIACWVNPTTFGYQTSALWATSNNSSVPTDYSTTTCSHTDTKLKIKGTDGTLYNLSCTSSDYPLNKWTYLVFTHDGVDAKLYTDGNFTRSIECPTSLVGFNFFYLGASNAGPRTTQGSWSDLRIYCTALSANDILELYNTSAFVDNQQNIDCFQFQENQINGSEITKQGQINCNIVNENIEASINYEGVVTANQLIEI